MCKGVFQQAASLASFTHYLGISKNIDEVFLHREVFFHADVDVARRTEHVGRRSFTEKGV